MPSFFSNQSSTTCTSIPDILLILPKSQSNASRILRKNTTLLTSNLQIITKSRIQESYTSIIFWNGITAMIAELRDTLFLTRCFNETGIEVRGVGVGGGEG